MDEATEAMTAELRDELASNEYRRKLIDPRVVPWRHHHLRAIGQSAAHCYQAFQDDKDQTLAMRLGSGTHALLFGKPVALWDQPAANGKGGKAPRSGAAWSAFKSCHPFATILNSKEMAKAERIASSIKRHPDANRLLFDQGVLHESQILWTQNGRRRQSTPDARSERSVIELKTTKCAQPERFARDAMYRGYHAQLADQMDAIEALDGVRPAAAYIVAVETVEPYVVTVLKLTDRAIEQGTRMNRLWFERLCVCADSNDWPAYLAGIGEFDVPDDEPELVFASDSTEEDQP